MPGVPPNAFAKLKQAFKGMLKGGNKKRQDQQEPAQNKTDQQDNAASKQDNPPKLPPTHPLVTGQQSQPQAAVPQADKSSAPEAVKPGSPGAGSAQEPSLKQVEDIKAAPASPIPSTSAVKDLAVTSEPVSAVKPLPPPKADGAVDESKAAAAPLPATPTADVTSTENTKPGSSTTSPVTANADSQPVPVKSSSESERVLDEKMPVMAEEPPEIKTKKAAPGMSATSGPLEDFPVGGDKP